jgi:hypothetical protein
MVFGIAASLSEDAAIQAGDTPAVAGALSGSTLTPAPAPKSHTLCGIFGPSFELFIISG